MSQLHNALYVCACLLGAKFRPLTSCRVILTRCAARICLGTPCCATCVCAFRTVLLYKTQVERVVLITREILASVIPSMQLSSKSKIISLQSDCTPLFLVTRSSTFAL